MKNFRICVLCMALCLASLTAYGEMVKSYARSGQTVTLDLGWNTHNYGDIQWQSSTDKGITWTDINGANATTYSFKITTETFCRAVVKGDPACPDVVVERHIIPVSFSTTVVELMPNYVTIEVTGADFADAVITEVGCAYGISGLSRDYTMLPRTRVDAGDVNGKSEFTICCPGMKPNTQYNVRVYFKTQDGSLIFGPGKLCTTLGGLTWSTEDWSIEKKTIKPRFIIDGATGTNLHFYYGTTEENMTELNVTTISTGVYSSYMRGLQPGQEYVVKATATIDGDEQVITKTVRTMSDYSNVTVDQTVQPVQHVVEWDNNNIIQLSPDNMQVEYPRVCRVNDDKLLLTFHGGTTSDYWKNSYICKSYDNGKTWTSPKMIFDASKTFLGCAYWRVCNPEMTRLQNGWILLSAVGNANPEGNDNSKVMISISKDDGETWSDPLVVGRGRTWEPQVVQMPNGEVELLVSSEAAWWGQSSMQQEILSTCSTDGGETWTSYKRAAYLPGARDGMPVSVVMQGNKGVMFVIESVGSGLPPSLVHRSLDGEWDTAEWDRVEDSDRWLTNLNNGAGAPHMIQLTTGEFLIMAHTNQTGSVWQTSRPQIVMADNTGHNFKYKRIPLASTYPSGTGCYYNSFFQYNNDTVWLLFTKAKYTGSNRDNSAIMLMSGKIVEK